MRKKTTLLIIFILILISFIFFYRANTNSIKAVTYEDIKYNIENPRKIKKLKTPISSNDDVLLHTVSNIILYDYGDEQLLYECFALIEYYENLLSSNEEKKETSVVYKLNNSNGEKIYFPDEALECLLYGYEYSKKSNDTFDITIGKLTSLWNFSEIIDTSVISKTAPIDSDIKIALETVDYNNLVIEGNYVSLKNPETNIELGAIAKGYIADKVADYLKSQGVNSAIINLGGNVYTIGYRDEKNLKDFKIGIRKPTRESIEEIGYVNLSNLSIVSSGDYEQYFIDAKTGILYSHILDKKTGYPVQSDITQVSIFTEKSVDGDGLSTIVYALGSEKGLELVESLNDVECMIIKKDGEIIFSENIGVTPDKKIIYVPR